MNTKSHLIGECEREAEGESQRDLRAKETSS